MKFRAIMTQMTPFEPRVFSDFYGSEQVAKAVGEDSLKKLDTEVQGHIAKDAVPIPWPEARDTPQRILRLATSVSALREAGVELTATAGKVEELQSTYDEAVSRLGAGTALSSAQRRAGMREIVRDIDPAKSDFVIGAALTVATTASPSTRNITARLTSRAARLADLAGDASHVQRNTVGPRHAPPRERAARRAAPRLGGRLVLARAARIGRLAGLRRRGRVPLARRCRATRVDLTRALASRRGVEILRTRDVLANCLRIEYKILVPRSSSSFAMAVHALALLASANESATSGRIAKSIGASGPHVRALLAALARERFVLAEEGRHGGYRLAREASSIRLSEVFVALDGGDVLTPNPCSPHPACFVGAGMEAAFSDVAGRVRRSVLAALGNLTVADVNRAARRASGIAPPAGFH